MPFSAIFDTAIGLVLVYLLLSMLNMSVNEAIAGLVRLRARVLFAEIDRILDDPMVRDRFWRSGLICSLGRADKAQKMSRKTAPSYICASSFAAALVDTLRRAGQQETAAAAPVASQPQAAAAVSTVTPADIQFDDRSLLALTGKIREDSILRDVLTGFAATAERSEVAFTNAIAEWFDQVMERAAGVYKRYMQLISLLVAIVIAGVMNADTLSMAEAIWQDKALQTQLVELGRKTVDQGLPQASANSLATTMTALADELHPLPLGWEHDKTSGIWKIIGLLLSAFAMTLGAPFWFDLLSRFVKIRSTGVVATRSVAR